MDSVQNRTEWECWKYALLSWTSCCYKLRARVRGFSFPLQDVTLRIASSHLPQGSPPHMGPTFLTASHTSSMIMVWELMLDRTLSCSPERSQIYPDQQRGSGAHSPDLSPFTPQEPDFPQRTLWGLWFVAVIFPGSGQRGRPPPSNKHIAHLSAKNINITIM